MTCRRLVLALLAAAALGAAWWLVSDGLTAEERQLVGTWQQRAESELDAATVTFGPDRRFPVCRVARNWPAMPTINTVGRWSRHGTVIYVDKETSTVRRAMRHLRPVAPWLGVTVPGAGKVTLAAIAADEMAITRPDGTREVWTRAPAD